MSDLRLAPGHHLYRIEDGSWNAASPGDRFLRLRVDDPEFERFVAGINGTLPAGAEDSAETHAQYAATLAPHGLLAPPAASPVLPRTASVLVAGADTPVGPHLVSLLLGEVQVRTGRLDAEAVEQADAVIACAGWLPDSAWRELDERCARSGTPWHRTHIEGTRLFAGPFTIPGRSPGYRDHRGRRLAAADAPDTLLDHWTYLDTDAPKPPPPWPGPGPVAVLAGHVVADVLAHLDGAEPPGAHEEVEIDPVTLQVLRHPVLPLPAFAD